MGTAGVGVSAREAEVLAALGEHLTNAEIAARLFISVRTVESHVSSLLRKLQVNDRRALAAAAATLRPAASASPAAALPLPSPLTSFVGRAAERAALADALGTHRLVAAIGPGGVGKTRLALSVVTDVAGRYTDGAWYVDLVPVTDPAMVAPAIAAALGLGERQGRSSEDTVLGWLAPRETLLVLDNCEHLLDGLPVLLERLLAGSPQLSVLVTSRARLLVPFEWVFPVPGLSIAAGDGGPGDAVELFGVRAAAAGSALTAADADRVAAVCRSLDGMALAIELTAARVPSLGLDGIEAGLADRMNLLTGGRRADDRHRSLQSALDWSYALLDEADRAVLRRISVFAAPFTAAAAQTVCAGVAAGRRRRRPGRAGPARRAEPAGRRGGSVRDPLPCPGDHPPVRRRPAGQGRGAGTGVLARERTRTFLAQADMARWARRLGRPRGWPRGWLAGGKRIRLRDGLARLTRPVRPADDGLLADGFARLSHADRRDHEALGALTMSAGAAWSAASCGHRGIDVTYPDALPAE